MVDLRDNLDCLPCGLNMSEATSRSAALIGVFNSLGTRPAGELREREPGGGAPARELRRRHTERDHELLGGDDQSRRPGGERGAQGDGRDRRRAGNGGERRDRRPGRRGHIRSRPATRRPAVHQSTGARGNRRGRIAPGRRLADPGKRLHRRHVDHGQRRDRRAELPAAGGRAHAAPRLRRSGPVPRNALRPRGVPAGRGSDARALRVRRRRQRGAGSQRRRRRGTGAAMDTPPRRDPARRCPASAISWWRRASGSSRTAPGAAASETRGPDPWRRSARTSGPA